MVEKSSERFNVERYDWASEAGPRSVKWTRFLKGIVRANVPHGIHTIVDVGCGNGEIVAAFKEVLGAREVIGLDISESSILHSKARGITTFKVDLGVERFPIEDSVADFVFCGELIEHIFDTDHVLSEIHRILRSRGKLLITTPNLASWFNRFAILCGWQPHLVECSTRYQVGKPRFMKTFDRPFGHIRAFTPRALKELLSLHGFQEVKAHRYAMSGLWVPVLFLDRIFVELRSTLSHSIVMTAAKA